MHYPRLTGLARLVLLAILPLGFSFPLRALELVDRARIPERDARGVLVASLAPLKFTHLPVLKQIIPGGGGGGGAVTLVSGTTAISGGGDTQVCFNDAAALSCGDAGLVYNKTTDTLTVTNIGATSFSGTVAATQNISFGANRGVYFEPSSTYPGMLDASAQTPDTLQIQVSTVSRALHVIEGGDEGFDFRNGRSSTSAATNPQIVVHSADQSVTEYTQISTDTTGAGHVANDVAEVTIGGTKANITEGSAQSVITFGLPSGGIFGATVAYTVFDTDGVDHVGRGGNIVIQGANKGGTAVCTINASRDTEAEDGSQIVNAAGAFTLTYTWTVAVSTSNCVLSINAASSAGANTLDLVWSAIVTGNSASITVTPVP